MSEFQPETRTREVRPQRTFVSAGRPIEQHLFDAYMVVKIFADEKRGNAKRGVQVKRRGTVKGERKTECLA